ncbi:MAG TPA: hypothetical protein VL069_14200 [Opitutus sp.]|nr:hypothetical protein [Opitutus sp.]
MKPDGTVSTLAGLDSVSGSNDGSTSTARFNQPRGLAVDSTGNVYVADSGNHTIRVISPTGVVTTLAGLIGTSGSADGIGAGATFNTPSGVAIDQNGNVFVADAGNHTIRKITASGIVSTYAGSPTQSAVIDGVGTAARFKTPAGLAFDHEKNLWVADADDAKLRKIAGDGSVTSSPGSVNGTESVGIDAAGQLYAPIKYGNFIRETVLPEGAYIIGSMSGAAGAAEGPDNLVQFNYPTGVAFGPDGTLYVADAGNRTIRKGVPVKITWATPAPIPVGTPLSSAQLNATANVEGIMTYSSNVGDVHGNGSIITATFLPTGAVAYLGTSVSVTITTVTATKSMPSITWPQPAPIAEGVWLTPTQLNATADVPGFFSYDPGLGTVLKPGSHILRAKFNPSDSAKYESPTAEVTLVVNIATPLQVISQPTAPSVSAGARASFSFSVSGSSTATYWQESRDGGTTWNYLADSDQYAGTHTATLTIASVSPSMNGFVYRCLVLSAAGGLTSNPATLSVASSAYLGGYFGTFAQGGSWALFVGSPNRFIAYLPGRSSAIVETLEMGADGRFQKACAEIVPGSASRTITLSGAVTVSGAGAPTVSGQLAEIGVTMTGAFPSSGALTYLSGDFFSASAIGANRGNMYAIVGYSGDIQIVFVTPEFVDGARGVLNSAGLLTMTTSAGRRLEVNVNPQSRTVSAVLSPLVSAPTGAVRTLALATGTGPIEFAGVSQSVISTTRFANIAARAFCTTGNGVTIGGFVVNGAAPKRVLIRAVGPSLSAQGIPASEVLQDPVVEVYDASRGNVVIQKNDDWGADGNAAQLTQMARDVGATAFASGDTTSAAMMLTLNTGVYSFVVTGKNSSSGVVLLEVYDADSAGASSQFVNIATRAYASTGNRIAIGGFVVSGNAPKQLLIRAVGPTLSKMGLSASQVLPDPAIEVYDAVRGNTIVATNDNWTDNGAADAISAAGARIGASPYDKDDSKSAGLLMTLKPGVYSFTARDKNNLNGVVLIEVYDAD